MQQLQLLKPKILKELNEKLEGETLADIFWKRGKVEKVEKEINKAPTTKEPTEQEWALINQLSKKTSDPDLNKLIKGLLIRHFSSTSE